MTLQEAIKSNKRFRRPCFPEGRWYSYDGSTVTCMRIDSLDDLRGEIFYWPDKQDILADDWEVEPVYITLSDKEFYEGVRNAFEEELKEKNIMYLSEMDFVAAAIWRYWRHISAQKKM